MNDVEQSEGLRLAPSDAELERAITSVPGVAEASLIRSGSGRGRLRLRLVPGEDTESVSWAVAATLRERFGIALDPDAIRPVEDEAQAAAAAAAGAPSAATTQDPIRLVDEPSAAPEPPLAPETTVPTPEEPAEPAPAAADRPVRLSDAAEAALASLGYDRPQAAPRGDPRQASARAPGLDDTLWGAAGSGTGSPPAVPGDQEHARDPGPSASDGSDEDGVEEEGDPVIPRLVITHLDTQRDAGDLRITATLRHVDRVGHGESRAVPTTHGLLRAVAEATLSAVRALCPQGLLVGVDRVSVQTGETPATASVVLSMLTAAGEETLLGSAVVRGDAEWAVMRATLDALNRRLAPLLEESA